MELRMIKPGWTHPMQEGAATYHDGTPRYEPMSTGYKKAAAEWDEGKRRWKAGERWCYKTNSWVVRTPDDGRYYGGQDNPRPRPCYYMPEWAEGEATLFVMYETVSAGTPVSPAFPTAEELARWLALNPSRFVRGTYQQWMSTIQQGSAFHGIIGAETGVLEAKTLHPTEQPVNIRITKIVSKTEMTFFCPASLYRRMKSLANTRMEVKLTETSPENYTATVSEEEWPHWATLAMDVFKRILTELIDKIDLELQLASVPE